MTTERAYAQIRSSPSNFPRESKSVSRNATTPTPIAIIFFKLNSSVKMMTDLLLLLSMAYCVNSKWVITGYSEYQESDSRQLMDPVTVELNPVRETLKLGDKDGKAFVQIDVIQETNDKGYRIDVKSLGGAELSSVFNGWGCNRNGAGPLKPGETCTLKNTWFGCTAGEIILVTRLHVKFIEETVEVSVASAESSESNIRPASALLGRIKHQGNHTRSVLDAPKSPGIDM